MKYSFLSLSIGIILMICHPGSSKAQTLTGTTGLFSIPTAETSRDSYIAIGSSVIDRKYLDYSSGKRSILSPFFVFGYLPFLEFTIRVSRQLEFRGGNHTVDRAANFKIKFYYETKYLPSFAIGFQNPYSTVVAANHFNSTYLVASKNIAIGSFLKNLSITAGYGSDIIKAADYEFIGLFGGMELTFNLQKYLRTDLSLIVEHDAERLNGALKIKLFDAIQIMGGLQGFDAFSGNLAFSFTL
jgi:hypothetical protein